MTDWQYLSSDDYRSPDFNELHARLENYQIYSIVICDHTATAKTDDHDFAVSLSDVPIADHLIISPVSIPANEFPGVYYDLLPDVIVAGVIYPRFGHAPGFRIYTKLSIVPGAYPGFDYGVVLDGFDSASQDASYLNDGFVVTNSLPAQDFTWIPGDPYPLLSSLTIMLGYTNYPSLLNHGSSIIPSTRNSTTAAATAIAFQSFDPLGLVSFDFAALADAYPVVKPGSITYNAVPANFLSFSESYNLGSGAADYRDLIFGHPQDSRILPGDILAIASTTRIIKFGYYRRNRLESHPKLAASLDWRSYELPVIRGEHYRLPLIDPVLGTMVVDATTRAEIISITQPNRYPVRFLFTDFLPDLVAYWNSAFYPAPPTAPAPTYPLASAITLTHEYEISRPPAATKQVVTTSYAPLVRVLGANNDRWGHGTVTNSRNQPSANHQIFRFDHQKLFETPQTDGSYGTYMTDSPRMLEIWAALEAGTYAIDPDTGTKRVANLGWMIEKVGNILGLRRKPSGKYLDKVDQAKFDRNRLNSPKWTQGDYDLNSWGNRGYALRHLPTTYADGQRQDNQYDLVHDIPQLLAAVLDQIDLGQGLQHTAEIRLKVGQEVQSYPNVGQLTIDLAARIIELEALVEKMAVMQIETANSVRELFPGIGIPVATKSVSIDIGGKQQRIFYPGFQAGKGSILDSLSAIKVNLGIVLGQLMPQKKPDSRWNPFDRKPKS